MPEMIKKRNLLSLYKLAFNDNHYDQKKQLLAASFFVIFIFIGLGIDSVYFFNNFFDGRWIMNCFAILHFVFFFYVSDSYLRKFMFVMLFLSYLGELICCNAFNMYQYRTDEIPLYVPFGHSILYATGFVFSQSNWAVKHKEPLQKFFIAFFIILLLGVSVFLYDIFSLIFGFCFFSMIKKRNWPSLYFFVSIWVVVLELAGTYYQCWGWHSKIMWVIPTVNPPMGAIFIYVTGDLVLKRLVHYLDAKVSFV